MNNQKNDGGTIVAIITVAALAVIAVLWVNNNMQKDRQAQAQIQREWDAKRESDQKRADEFVKQERLNQCLKTADDTYWSYVKLNSTSSKQTPDGVVYTAAPNVWSIADGNRKDAKDLCYRAN